MFAALAGGPVLPELAVCDPLTRGHTRLPPIPDSLAASVFGPGRDEHVESFDAFFVPSRDYEEAQFRVIGWTQCEAMAVVFVYSSVSGSWTVGTSISWNELGLNVQPGGTSMPCWWPSYAYGCFYWKVLVNNKLLKLDMNRMEFSTVDLPPNHGNRQTVVVEAGEGRTGILAHSFGQEIPPTLHYSIRQNEEGYIFLNGSRYIYHYQQGRGVLFGGSSAFLSLEIKTLKIERVCSASGGCGHIFP
ncbi:hypothetical protein BAE44_0001101 [Dichanthelium oligosanthes]|uniref:Uncharacterized protein n=1 Tax=Dichanthelium oligosanthes TaxID=888268 RepID=A0A1E5WL79_9POAL|nr:hypothetical protein BAE44_0001101 [Dichanthelium oligosanthes]